MTNRQNNQWTTSWANHRCPIARDLYHLRHSFHKLILGIRHRLSQQFLVLELGLFGSLVKLLDLRLHLGNLLLVLFLARDVFAKNHLFLPEIFIDLGHRIYLVLSDFKLLEYFFDVFLLESVLIPQFCKEILQLIIFLMESLIVLFEFLVVHVHSLQLN